MQLHKHQDEFHNLITIVAKEKHIPESAVERDYFIVFALLSLSQSEFAPDCVFKGGTSLSKCYPGSIERFSEDIDLTFVPEEGMSDKQIERRLKSIEKLMTADFETEIIPEERNDRNKSIFFWYGDHRNKIKLEIGSSVRPEPYSTKILKTYIQEYLESQGFCDAVAEYALIPVTVNVLNNERTFIDKVMSVKRHSISGTIAEKARHIYDVKRLFNMPEIQRFLQDKASLKALVDLTKQTDSIYLKKRNIPAAFNPLAPYDFGAWKANFHEAKDAYEHLHEDLLYTDEKQIFTEAAEVFEQISVLMAEIEE